MRFAAILFMLVPINSGPSGGPEFTSPAGTAHYDQIEFYASVIAGAARAEKICEGYRTNITVLGGLRAKMAIRIEDRPEVERRARQAERHLSAQIEQTGVASWCASILGLFGPDGTIMPGLLELR
jgi:hypothetical protein